MVKLNQTLKQTQGLVITPRLQQAIKLLSMTHLEISNAIAEEMMENPLLEEGNYSEEIGSVESNVEAQSDDFALPTVVEKDDFDWDSYMASYNDTSSSPPTGQEIRNEEREPIYERAVAREHSLADHLQWQLRMENLSGEENSFALEIIHNLTDEGYLDDSLEHLAKCAKVSLELAKKMQETVQRMDPVGCGSENLEQCLLFQADILGARTPLVEKIIYNYLGDKWRSGYEKMAEELEVAVEEVENAFSIVKEFNPRPGFLINSKATHYIVPDIFVVERGGSFVVKVNDEGVPPLQISHLYQNILKQSRLSNDTAKYVREKLSSALWLIKSVQRRQKTIYKVAKAIIERQQEFFKKGPSFLRPMVLRDIASEIGVHDSTVSRATTNKYMHTPVGIFEMKYFFNSAVGGEQGLGVSGEVIKNKIKEFIEQENPKRPLSDQKIANLLIQDGLTLARRTVAKYREELEIPSSAQRKKK